MDINRHNQEIWNSGAYAAWVHRFGAPVEAAAKLMRDPLRSMGALQKHLPAELTGKKIINLLGSNGSKAVALALLGADAAVVDYSSDNERYAKELAGEAGVDIRYILSDVLQLPENEMAAKYDVVLMENGILHYFAELTSLFGVVTRLLRTGGKLILQDFHPVSTKLISSKGTTANIRKHKVTGDYFDTSLKQKEVSFSKFLEEPDDDSKVYLREWTLGEVVTSIAGAGLFVRTLEELPNLSSETFDKGIPKTYIVVAEKQ
jgi:SAM-dependent methyltransferase